MLYLYEVRAADPHAVLQTVPQPTADMYNSFTRLVLVVVVAVLGCFADDVTDGTELVLAFLVHRHGDRTPVDSTISFSSNSDELELRTERYGYGQLTDEGKRTGYELGKYLRQRYDVLLSPQYNRSELYVRCTDSTRTKMTALTALAALYPASSNYADNWSRSLAWQPIPYTTLPAKYDSNLAVLNCPTFMSFYNSVFTSSSDKMSKYNSLFERWNKFLSFNITAMPVISYMVYDVYTSQIGLGIPLGEELEELFPEIEKAAGTAIGIIFGDEDYIALQAGVLLNEFLEVSEDAIEGEDTQRVRILSAHDYNVFSFMSVLRLEPEAVPKYGSAIALELRKVTTTGKYVVLPVYLPSPWDLTEQSVQYIQVSGCDDLLCDYDQFVDLTANYVMNETDWRSACGFTDDLEVDDSSVA